MDFKAWFSGFAAGEGSFVLTRRQRPDRRNDEWRPRFDLRLRRDDKAILERLATSFGGRVYDERVYSQNLAGANPASCWAVYRLSDCRGLVNHFRSYPLLAKKQRDFDLWALAVDHLALGISHRNNDYLEALRVAMQAGRQYDGQQADAIAEPPQLRLVEEIA